MDGRSVVAAEKAVSCLGLPLSADGLMCIVTTFFPDGEPVVGKSVLT